MKKQNNKFTKGEAVSCLFMLLALLWLTVSLPFVNYAQQFAEEQLCDNSGNSNSSQQNMPTEEKTETGNNGLSEYLHDHHFEMHEGYLINLGYKLSPDDTYLAFHPEQLLLPPEA
jgi:hypothetical protein